MAKKRATTKKRVVQIGKVKRLTLLQAYIIRLVDFTGQARPCAVQLLMDLMWGEELKRAGHTASSCPSTMCRMANAGLLKKEEGSDGWPYYSITPLGRRSFDFTLRLIELGLYSDVPNTEKNSDAA